MRISPIHNITFKSNNEIKQSKPSDNEKGLNNSAKLALGVSGGAALGVAAYFLFRGKPVEKIILKLLNRQKMQLHKHCQRLNLILKI